MIESGNETMRRLRFEDVQAALQLSAQAGWNQTEEDWCTLLELSPEGCLVMEVDGRLAATATLLCYGRRLAWIGMVLTKLEYQRRGFAKTLLAIALERAEKMGIETIKLDATEQGRPLYERFGFRVEREIERWSRTGDDVEPLPAGPASADKPWYGSDSSIFGADRSQLLDRLAHRNPPISISNSYLFSRPGRVTAYLGPCISEDPGIARRMIEECLQGTSCGWSWDLFPENRAAVEMACDLGFYAQRHLVRMARGKKLRVRESAIYAIAGFEFG